MSTPFSIIIPSHNQAPELRRHLPVILEQDYDEFEVIVVDVASVDETKEVLEDLELRYPTLRHTQTPASARDISLERLALTLGFRAAHYEWVIITHANCEPESSQWLQSFGKVTEKQKDILIGAAKWDEKRRSWFDYKVGFFRMWNTLANINHIRSGNAAVRCDGCNVAIRRSLFLNSDGFGDHLNLLTGAEELLVNRLSTPENTISLRTPNAIVVEDCMKAKRLWKKQRMYYMETRKYQRHTFSYRTKQNLRLILPWVTTIGLGAIWPLLHYFFPEDDLIITIIVGLVTLLVLFFTFVGLNRMNRAAHILGYQRSYYLTGLLFSFELPLWNLSAWLGHLLSPKAEFCKKFV